MPRFAPRIHVLLASDAPVALVIRRGPSKSVATLLWDRRRDEFKLGQWLKGRIYERRSDLSPDGKYAIYFAMNGKRTSESKGSRTAISRVPYLKAIAFFPKGDCWHGSALWTGKSTYWLNDGYGHTIASGTTAVRRDRKYSRPAVMAANAWVFTITGCFATEGSGSNGLVSPSGKTKTYLKRPSARDGFSGKLRTLK